MTIDRLGSTSTIQNLDSAARNISSVTESRGDSVSISGEGVKRAEFFRTAEIVHAGADVRMDRVAEVKSKLANPGYISSLILEKTADKILDQLLGS